MEGQWISENDGWGIIGWSYLCPKCEEVTRFCDCEKDHTVECENCGFVDINCVDPE